MLLVEEEKRKLVEHLWSKGIKNEDILKAIYKVNRERFISSALRKLAYDDNALPIECAQTISQPFTVAYMTQALEVKPGDKILEIGTGSGYQAAILCELGGEVYTIERIEKLHENSKKLLASLGYKVHLKLCDGTLGWEEFAPYDKIIVTAGAPVVPENLLTQLSTGGILVIPVGSIESQRLHVITKTEDGTSEKKFEHFKFVPLIGEEGWKPED
ncbi:MAG: protein-L-isoaspartate(D-aspartate) O-methyltransferase [Ignavibacteria bacterium]|nr:protein-L-isoaspartate(D-aspartate) O-methyltransferase [Ignavibacteria bacterium]MCC7159516.1 protein-L-isoaspartate(D-aspartate) O-methyltransferase [Ignavibacteria bacterium]